MPIMEQMKQDLMLSHSIKEKLIKGGVWTTKNIAESLKTNCPFVEEVKCNDKSNCITATMNKEFLYLTNTLNTECYDSISESVKKVFYDNDDTVKNTLTDNEYKHCINNKKSMDIMYDISNTGKNVVIMHI